MSEKQWRKRYPHSEVTEAVMGDDTYGYAYDPIGSGIVTTEHLANALTPYTNILCVPASLRLTCEADGSPQGAGGVGGLLAVSVDGQYYFPCSDHNGNVMATVSESGVIVAQYAYTQFGEGMSAAGPMAGLFRFRFSTKYQDEASGLYYYGYRFYDPDMGRFLSRDPIEEQGGLNLYGFAGNDPVNRWDLLGLTQEDRWNKRVLSNAEGHTYGCAEWKCHKEGFSGVANRASYVRHFEIKSLAFINMDKTLKRTMADELVSSIGIPINDEITLWEMSFLETAMHYTDYKKKADSTCKSGCRYYIDMVLRVVIADIKSMNSSKVESHVFTNNGDKSKSKIATSKVHNVDKECVQ